MEDASKILHLEERCSRYSWGVYRNEKQGGRRLLGVLYGGFGTGIGGNRGRSEGFTPNRSVRTVGLSAGRSLVVEHSRCVYWAMAN